MLIERRAYTFRPGGLTDFVDAQAMLGFDPVTRPTMGRLIGYFVTEQGDHEQIVHYWRFDSYDDWMARLHRKDPSREPYFRRVRALMLEQENRFLLPAPVGAFTPLWGNGKDWLPGDAPIADATRQPGVVVEESVLQFPPGGLPALWEVLREEALLAADAESAALLVAGLLGCFYTLVGRQHEVIWLRWHHDPGAAREHAALLARNPIWQDILARCLPGPGHAASRLMTLPARAPMVPLFRLPEGDN